MTDLAPLTPTDTDVELLQELRDGYGQLRGEIAKVIIGQEHIVRALLAAMFSGGHVLLIGVPGLAKTRLVKTLSDVLSWEFQRIQFTPDLMPSDITGVELLQVDPEGQRHMEFIPGPIFSNLVLADEINRTPPKTQSALLEAMQERHVTSAGKLHQLPDPFMVVATQNPIEQEGTYPLPEAQLDRFMFSLWMEYPSREDEEDIVMATTGEEQHDLHPVFSPEKILQFQDLIRRVPVSRHVVRYAVALARATRPAEAEAPELTRNYVEWGAGPRAAQHMVLGAKALAVLDGEPAPGCDHIREAAQSVLRHRVIPNYQAAGEGKDAAELIQGLIAAVAEPRG